MHFVTIVPLSLAILYVIFKFFFIGTILLIGVIAYLIYAFFFKKDKVSKEVDEDANSDFNEEINDYMEKLSKEINDAEAYRNLGKLEAQLDALEKQVGIKKRKRKRSAK